MPTYNLIDAAVYNEVTRAIALIFYLLFEAADISVAEFLSCALIADTRNIFNPLTIDVINGEFRAYCRCF